MTVLQAVLLGVLQGLTEFLPISSSGHLVIVQRLMGLQDPSLVFTFDIAVHVGTLLAVIVAFSAEIRELVRRPFSRLMLMLVIATLPAVVVGLGFKDQIEALFTSPRVAAVGLLMTGLLLWLTRWIGNRQGISPHGPRLWEALVVGCAQAVAITPGISRSGSTIATGLYCQWDRNFAARFSFLMAIPAIAGAALLQSFELNASTLAHTDLLLIGIVSSGVTGLFAIKMLLWIIGRGRLHYFAYYCWGIGLLATFLLS